MAMKHYNIFSLNGWGSKTIARVDSQLKSCVCSCSHLYKHLIQLHMHLLKMHPHLHLHTSRNTPPIHSTHPSTPLPPLNFPPPPLSACLRTGAGRGDGRGRTRLGVARLVDTAAAGVGLLRLGTDDGVVLLVLVVGPGRRPGPEYPYTGEIFRSDAAVNRPSSSERVSDNTKNMK